MAIPAPVVQISLPGRPPREYPTATRLGDIISPMQSPGEPLIVGGLVNYSLRELSYPVTEDATIQPVDLSDERGVRIYWRSLSLVLVRAARELFPDARVCIEHSLGKGIYGEVFLSDNRRACAADFRAIEARMHEIITRDEPIIRLTLPVDDAVPLFEADGQHDKVRLLKYRKSDHVKVYRCGWLHDYFYGYMVPSTGYLRLFALIPYSSGFILMFPRTDSPSALPEFRDYPRLAQVFGEYERWGRILEVDFVASLNDRTSIGQSGEIVRIAEALHEKKIAAIADQITEEGNERRLVLIAGPSSSGKTTFAHRLMVQLKVNGLKPITVSLDDYFVNRDCTPRDENGHFDFESIEAIDLELFYEQLQDLLAGRPVELPRFNFKTGRRETSGLILRVRPDQPVLIEGIHGLNERLTAVIPRENKFKIYISPLTQLNLDEHNRIPTTDNRIIRRIVRDHRSRGYSARDTIGRWASVRRGEERHIFPFQEEADVMFNSALVYELAVLKPYVLPLLQQVEAGTPEFPEAHRLLKFLQYFLPMPDCEVPLNSILREFIGSSCFYRES